jgi:transcriptional regulator with XRE-family HTH domain
MDTKVPEHLPFCQEFFTQNIFTMWKEALLVIMDAIVYSFIMTFEEVIGNRIRQVRRSKLPVMSIEKLAELSGLSRQTITSIEKGKSKKVAISTITAIARALSASLDDLTGDAWKNAAIANEQASEYLPDNKKAGNQATHAQRGKTVRKPSPVEEYYTEDGQRKPKGQEQHKSKREKSA